MLDKLCCVENDNEKDINDQKQLVQKKEKIFSKFSHPEPLALNKKKDNVAFHNLSLYQKQPILQGQEKKYIFLIYYLERKIVQSQLKLKKIMYFINFLYINSYLYTKRKRKTEMFSIY